MIIVMDGSFCPSYIFYYSAKSFFYNPRIFLLQSFVIGLQIFVAAAASLHSYHIKYI